MAYLTVWKDKWACHCPNCDNVWDLQWWDGEDKLGLGQYRCPRCLTVFVPTGKLFKSTREEHGTLTGNSYTADESETAKARRLARE